MGTLIVPEENYKNATMTRQRRWQLRMIEEGRCSICGRDGVWGKTKCRECADRAYVAKHGRAILKPRHTKAEWDVVDWSMRNAAIGRVMGVTHGAVEYQRRKRFGTRKAKRIKKT